MKEETDKGVREDVQEAFRILAKAANVPISEQELPRVEINSGQTHSGYHYEPKTGEKTIYITPERIGDGTAYFEEASHALRDLEQTRRGVAWPQQDKKVQEFYGRLGETLGRANVKGTKLAEVFAGRPVRDTNTPEKRKDALESYKSFRKNRRALTEQFPLIQRGNEVTSTVLSNHYTALAKAFRDYLDLGASREEFARRVGENAQYYKSDLQRISADNKGRKLSLTPSSTAAISKFMELYGNIGKLVSTRREEQDFKKGLESIRASLEDYSPASIQEQFFKDPDKSYIEKFRAVDNGLHLLFTHRKPYVYAEQYTADELSQTEGLYALADREARQRFFRRKQSGLEKTVEAVFLLTLPFFILFSLINFNATGFSIFSSENSTVNFQAFFGLIAFFSAILLAFFKIRSRIKVK